MISDIDAVIREFMLKYAAPGCQPGLQRIESLLNYLENPQRGLNCIHIAGTNGKGSTTAILAAVLRRAGYKVGTYMSPHISTYKERWAINGLMIDDDELNDLIQDLITAHRQMPLDAFQSCTEFEMLTALAYMYFARNNVDIAIIETGLGGIYDATNVITPMVSVITSISYDHMEFLGDSLEEIAWNKAGIIKREVPVVVGPMPKSAHDVIQNIATQCQAQLIESSAYRITCNGLNENWRCLVDICGPDMNIQKVEYGLLGIHQLDNLALCLTVLTQIGERGYSYRQGDFLAAISDLVMPGRLEVLSTNPPVILDVGHNPAAADCVAETLRCLLPNGNRIWLCGYLDDKDRSSIMSKMAPGTRKCYVSRPLGERSSHWQETARLFKQYNPEAECFIVEEITDALLQALNSMQENDYLLAGGSFYVSGPIREYFVGKSGKDARYPLLF